MDKLFTAVMLGYDGRTLPPGNARNCLGITALNVYNNLTFADGEVKSVHICMNKLEQQIVGQINKAYERYIQQS